MSTSVRGLFAQHNNSFMWNTDTLCLMWTIWRNKNNCSFNILEMSSVAIKSVFLRSWYDSSTVICGVLVFLWILWISCALD